MGAVLQEGNNYQREYLTAAQNDAVATAHLDRPESEAIHIMREVIAEAPNPALWFSGGKDFIVILHHAEKAFRPDSFPLPLLHIDTEHNFQEVIDSRDQRAADLNERLIVRSVQTPIDKGRVVPRCEDESRNAQQTITLRDAIKEFDFDALSGAPDVTKKKPVPKSGSFPTVTNSASGIQKKQRPELCNLYNAGVHRGEHLRAFPSQTVPNGMRGNTSDMKTWRSPAFTSRTSGW